MSDKNPWGLLHGADYNYEQWLDFPEILDKDLVYMREAEINVLAVGIFSWAKLESEEGVYHFEWMDECFERLSKNGQKIILATPSGSKPAWLSEKYPEVCQMTVNGERQPYGGRHNHCRSSVRYREACVRINTKLAQRYGAHPALILWHVSNEYNGIPCYCPQCLAAFREWLKKRYGTLDALNAAWYTTFWSHSFSAWEQIYPADISIHGMALDWQRFTSDQTIDFFLAESEPLRRITPDIPVTTNFQMPDSGLDYHKLARYVDIISWDNYPSWHSEPDDVRTAIKAGFFHDLCRSYRNKPFLMMESSPSATNWQGVCKKKKRGMLILSSMQAIAHGSDSVQYFQWRQSRGGAEKFHDAVVSHIGTDDTRIFRGVAETGAMLKKLNALAGSNTVSKAAVVYDFQNSWALNNAFLLRNAEKNYQGECIAQYGAFWKAGISCDVIGCEYSDFEPYRLIVFPMFYMLDEAAAEKIRSFVRKGGIAIATYLTGIVNENDLCYLGGTPGNLTDVFGLAVEETETIADYENPEFRMEGHNWKATHYADHIRLRGAEMLGELSLDGEKFPAVTVNKYGEGRAYYVCVRTEQGFLDQFYPKLCIENNIMPCIRTDNGSSHDAPGLADIPAGISVQKRGNALFIMNFNSQEKTIALGNTAYIDLLSNKNVGGTVSVAPYGVAVVEEKGSSG